MAITGLTVMAPADPAKRLCYLNGALNALEVVQHHIGSDKHSQAEFRSTLHAVRDERQKLLQAVEVNADAEVPRRRKHPSKPVEEPERYQSGIKKERGV